MAQATGLSAKLAKGREKMYGINGHYTQDQLIEIVEHLITAGWKWKSYSYTPQVKGWWVLEGANDPIKRERRGDPKQFYEAAMIVAELYEPSSEYYIS